jgi:thiamine-phosphate pyrophosphorylase
VILCLVTDRRRLWSAVGGRPADAFDLLVQQISGAIAGGVDLIQVREPDLEAGELLGLVRRILASVPDSASRLIVNDRLDVALASRSAGVHLKENSFAVHDARRISPPSFIVGKSVHGSEAARVQAGASYLIAGTVKPTSSKPHGRYLGYDGLAAVVAAAGRLPVLAIGGLSLSDAPIVAATGAKGMAAIGAFIPDGELDLGPYAHNQAEKLRFAFDSVGRVT